MDSLSKQRRWQIRKKQLGYCIRCGKRKSKGKALCSSCRIKHNELRRTK